MTRQAIPADEGWIFCEPTYTDEGAIDGFTETPVVAWLLEIESDDVAVTPIMHYGSSDAYIWLLKAPTGGFWEGDNRLGHGDEYAVKLLNYRNEERKKHPAEAAASRFGRTRKHTVETAQAVEMMVGPEGFEPPTRPL
jgi:hypothetical protein